MIPMFFQVVVTSLYFLKKNRIKYITLGVVRVTTFTTLILEIAMGLALIIISFDISSNSQSIRDYNECFVGTYQTTLQNFPYIEGKLMGDFKFFVIFLTVFIFILAGLLVFMQIFSKVYKDAEDSV
jgi:hypothetical protein